MNLSWSQSYADNREIEPFEEIKSCGLVLARRLGTGVQCLFRYANGFGASVIRSPYSYGGEEGLFEVAVIKFSGESDTDYTVTPKNELLDDPQGWVTPEQVDDLLLQIAELDSRGRKPRQVMGLIALEEYNARLERFEDAKSNAELWETRRKEARTALEPYILKYDVPEVQW